LPTINIEIYRDQRCKYISIECSRGEQRLIKLELKKDFLESILRGFKERRENFDKLFDRLDKGIESNNLELIAGTLGAIVDIAKSSPIKHLQKMKDDFNNPNIKEIEF